MPVHLITSGAADGRINGSNATYATARNTSAAAAAGGATIEVGQRHSVTHRVDRGFLLFNRSGLPAATRGRLWLACAVDSSTAQDFDVEIVEAAWSGDITANREADYDLALSASLAAVWRNTSGIATDTPYASPDLPLAYLNATAVVYYALRSSRDSGNNQPANSTNEFITIHASEATTAAYRPMLELTLPDGTSVAVLAGRSGGGGVIRTPGWMRRQRWR